MLLAFLWNIIYSSIQIVANLIKVSVCGGFVARPSTVHCSVRLYECRNLQFAVSVVI